MRTTAMSQGSKEDLYARLAELRETLVREEELEESEEKRSDTDPVAEEERLHGLLRRINNLAGGADVEEPAEESKAAIPLPNGFLPAAPKSLRNVQMPDSEIEALILKFLLNGAASGREVAAQIRLPFVLLDDMLYSLKAEQHVVYRGAAPMNDYVYELTDSGRERARRFRDISTYHGSVPVSLAEYVHSVSEQSLQAQNPNRAALELALSDLLINKKMLDRLGPAVNSGKGMFLYGFPGNGKTSIAKRVTKVFGEAIWVPRAVVVDGEIIRVYDPQNHEELPLSEADLPPRFKLDQRWVRIRRPTIVVGGELTMERLEIARNQATGISEAPLQMKANCGVFVIDDFGRQRISTDELLNRWIVPLEERVDYLNLSNGKSIQVPFDELIVFSTNLEPKDLVDEAFLRRIPYKIEVIDPTEAEFRQLFKLTCQSMNVAYRDDMVTYLIENHYKPVSRPFRACQPRDLMLQIRNHCAYQQTTLEMKRDYFDAAAENYFAVM